MSWSILNTLDLSGAPEAVTALEAVGNLTSLAAERGKLIMGLWAKWPVAMAPGMGLNAFFAFGVVIGMKQTWEVALGAVFLAGILFFILSLTGLRQWIINSIPHSLKLGIGAGIDRIEPGIRLRYEFVREFAPYIGIAQGWKVGR